MNGFKLLADSWRKLIKEGQVTEEEAGRKVEIYDFLATCSREDFFALADSSAFNDIITGYCKKALIYANVPEETREHVLSELRWLFDSMGAAEVCRHE